jgi:phospholipid/cholesterol/gamma-HCH transport system substrate-binding protein
MDKTAHPLSRILIMVVFALSCFGLLIFLWLSFGGAVPLKPQGYRVRIAFPEATTLAEQADVRIAGVSVGKVQHKDIDPHSNRTLAILELDKAYAPLPANARAILRQKTLLGETYVELTPGSGRRMVADGGRLPDGQVKGAVQLDEIFDAFDPQTREAYRTWQQDLAKGTRGRGRDFNDALGTLPGFARDGTDLLTVLNSQEGAVSRLVKNTGVVFGALSENQAQLRNLITGSSDVFDATASQNDALAETFKIFPTFLDESKVTLARLKTFSGDTRPLIQDLRPVARDLKPTVRDIRLLSPDLKKFFTDLDPLITASKKGLPATSETLRGLQPVLERAAPFLGQFNPILQYLEQTQGQVSDFIANGGAAQADTTVSKSGGVGHYLRQFGVTGAESVATYRERLANNRGNTYFGPLDLVTPPNRERFPIFPNFDCRNTSKGGEVEQNGDEPACMVAPRQTFKNKLQARFPHVEPEGYGG